MIEPNTLSCVPQIFRTYFSLGMNSGYLLGSLLPFSIVSKYFNFGTLKYFTVKSISSVTWYLNKKFQATTAMEELSIKWNPLNKQTKKKTASKYSARKFSQSLDKLCKSNLQLHNTMSLVSKEYSRSEKVTELRPPESAPASYSSENNDWFSYRIRPCQVGQLPSDRLALSGMRSQLWKYQWPIWLSWRKDALR